MLDSIVNYIDFLKKHFDLSVSIHGTDGRLDPYMSSLAPYNIHSNPYCLFVKSSKQNWNLCRIKQQRAAQAAKGGLIFGSCYCGVAEYMVPIKYGDEYMGFISVGGYRGSEEKRDHFAEKYGFSLDEIRDKYKTYLSPTIPDEATVRTLIEPLAAMLALLFINKTEEAAPSGDGYVYGHIVSYLHNHIGERILLSDIAEFCHYSPSFITRLFKSRSGMTINEYLQDIRMKKARDLLLKTDMQISEISEACGFSDTNYFIACFSERYGTPPKRFRKQALQST